MARNYRVEKQTTRKGMVWEITLKQPKSTEEVAQQLEQESDDDELWSQEPVPIERRPSRTSVLSLRLPTAEFHTLLKAARGAGESVSAYVRKAIAMRQTLQPTSPTVTISYTYEGMPGEVELSHWRTYTSGNPQPEPTITSAE